MSTQPLLQRTAQKRIALPVRVEPKTILCIALLAAVIVNFILRFTAD
ncbi:hypothetical protein SIIN_5884_T [Serendipita indica DSM 11827]|nr:hypothetical protein SIIN_5884_T [Serendipita indica DSM 11827]